MISPASRPDGLAGTRTPATRFTLYEAPASDELNSRFDEALMQHAASSGPSACIWMAPQGLVVPRTYMRSATFDETCVHFAAQGWPVSIRHSGGGVVPQGPGILNISLAYSIEGKPLDHSDAAYQLLCDVISNAASRFNIDTHAQAVEGSFCDGRFNLACGTGDQARKVAGTAQLWRRQPLPAGGTRQVVLVHALLMVATDIPYVTQQANALERALGNSRRYLPERAVSMHELASLSPTDRHEFVNDVREALHAVILTLRE